MEEESLAQTYKDEGNLAFKSGKYTDAVEHYTKAIAYLKEKTFYTNRALAFIKLCKYQKAAKDCEEAIKIDKGFAKAYLRLAECQMATGLLKEAVDTLNKGIDEMQQNQELREMHSVAKNQLIYKEDLDIAWEKKDWETVIRKIDCLLEKCVYDRSLVVKQMEAYNYNGENKKANEVLEKWKIEFGIYPEFKWAIGLTLLYRGEGREKIALEIWKDGVKMDPDYPRFRESTKTWKDMNTMKDDATKLFQAGKYEEAMKKYQDAAKIDPFNRVFNSPLYMNIGTCLAKQGKHKEAIREYTKSIEMNPSYAKAYQRRATAYQELDNWIAAEEDLRRAQSHDQMLVTDADIRAIAAKAKKQSKKDYYSVLGVAKDATEADIKKAFKKKTLELHPDRHADAPEEEKKENELKFKEANEAYSVLSDPKKRQMVDNGVYDPNGGGGHDFDFGGMGGMGGHGVQINLADLFGMFGGMGGMGGGFPGGMGGGMGGFPGGFSFSSGGGGRGGRR